MYDIYDNDFDKAFDEAVEAIEKKEHRLIWADKLKKHYAWWQGGTLEKTLDEMKRDFDTIVDLQPTVPLDWKSIMDDWTEHDNAMIAKGREIERRLNAPKHGRWIYDEHNGNYYCSECHRRGGVYIDGDNGIELLGNYCGICGAKMDLDEVEE